jgi:hypothetical protein
MIYRSQYNIFYKAYKILEIALFHPDCCCGCAFNIGAIPFLISTFLSDGISQLQRPAMIRDKTMGRRVRPIKTNGARVKPHAISGSDHTAFFHGNVSNPWNKTTCQIVEQGNYPYISFLCTMMIDSNF